MRHTGEPVELRSFGMAINITQKCMISVNGTTNKILQCVNAITEKEVFEFRLSQKVRDPIPFRARDLGYACVRASLLVNIC